MNAAQPALTEISAPRRRSAWVTRKAPGRVFARDHVLRRESLGIYALADGDGEGAPADAAGAAVLRALGESLGAWASLRASGPVVAAVTSLQSANEELLHLGSMQSGYPTMSASAGLLLVDVNTIVFAMVGDVALLRVRDGELQRVGPRWIRSHRMGLGEVVPVETLVLTARPGDVLLLASDGLHEHLPSEAETRMILRQGPELAASYLAAHAQDLGSDDDASALVVELAGPSLRSSALRADRRLQLR